MASEKVSFTLPFQGTRVHSDERGFLNSEAMRQPGAYGRVTSAYVKLHPRMGHWQVTAPDGSAGSLNPAIHRVIEHDDGTITVTPSIDYSMAPWFGFHGWLTKGVFT